MTVLDCIRLRNMVFYTHHGVLAAEREMGQRLEVDVELRLDLSEPGSTDNLAATVDYAAVYALVRRVVEEQRLNLIEAVAEAVARGILSACRPEQVTVRVRKPNPPVGGVVDCAEVEVVRTLASNRGRVV